MQKEKKVRTYQRRTKSGKMVTVRAHTAKYDAAEEAKELAKKKGSGDELEMRKRKLAMKQLAGKKAAEELEKKVEEKESEKEKEPKKKSRKDKTTERKAEQKASLRKPASFAKAAERKAANEASKKKESSSTKSSTKSSEPAFTAAEYKAWYHWDKDADPNNKAAQKVAKALRAQMGRAGYNKYFNEMTDKYSARGHISAYKKVGSVGSENSTPTKKSAGEIKRKISELDSHAVKRYSRFNDVPERQAKSALMRMEDSEYKRYFRPQDIRRTKTSSQKESTGKTTTESKKKYPSGIGKTVKMTNGANKNVRRKAKKKL